MPCSHEDSAIQVDCRSAKPVTLNEFNDINRLILGPDEYGEGCPSECGCPSTPSDCPRHYEVSDVFRSANAILDTKSSIYFVHELERNHVEAIQQCKSSSGLGSGGWCLSSRKIHKTEELPDGRVISIPQAHVSASERLGFVITEMIKNENVTSVSDFGAGVGQYGHYFKTRIPDLVYYAYDGAGDIESFTNGFVKYSDFTQPLELPITEWVMSLEVGEHIPSKYEGMFIRNLHRHNCKGVILSWGVLGQGGENHINLHSNIYIEEIFDELGYYRDLTLEEILRKRENNYWWFTKSIMVYRQRHSSCGGGDYLKRHAVST